MVGVHSKAELNKEENRKRNNKGGIEKEMQKKENNLTKKNE
jgi:hypothetical protein